MTTAAHFEIDCKFGIDNVPTTYVYADTQKR